MKEKLHFVMKQELIKKMIAQKRVKLGFWESCNHYSIVFCLLLFVGFTDFDLIKSYFTHTYGGVRSANELINFSLPFLIAAIVFAFIQWRRLNFYVLKVAYTEADFDEALKRTIKELGWKIENRQKRFLQAYRPSNWSASWGERITIIKDTDRLLINSICDPDARSSVASFGWNKKNIRIFVMNLNDVINQIPEKEIVETETSENEWSLKRTIIRIAIYPFCVFLIIIGIYMIIEPHSSRNKGAGIAAVLVAGVYLYADIKLITSKNPKKTVE